MSYLLYLPFFVGPAACLPFETLGAGTGPWKTDHHVRDPWQEAGAAGAALVRVAYGAYSYGGNLTTGR